MTLSNKRVLLNGLVGAGTSILPLVIIMALNGNTISEWPPLIPYIELLEILFILSLGIIGSIIGVFWGKSFEGYIEEGPNSLLGKYADLLGTLISSLAMRGLIIIIVAIIFFILYPFFWDD